MSIYASTKALYSEAMDRYAEAIRDGKDDRSSELRRVTGEVFNNTIDDNERLMGLLKETEDKLKSCLAQR